MAEIVLDESNFEQEVINSEIPVLVDFWAEWCGPCKMLGPVISSIAEKYDGKIKVGKVNVDEAMELAEEYGAGVWDLYGVMGGAHTVNAWRSAGLAKQDRLHFTEEGYTLLADLFAQALLADYLNHR